MFPGIHTTSGISHNMEESLNFETTSLLKARIAFEILHLNIIGHLFIVFIYFSLNLIFRIYQPLIPLRRSSRPCSSAPQPVASHEISLNLARNDNRAARNNNAEAGLQSAPPAFPPCLHTVLFPLEVRYCIMDKYFSYPPSLSQLEGRAFFAATPPYQT